MPRTDTCWRSSSRRRATSGADGGSPAERSRIIARIVGAIRASAPELLIGIRLSTEGEREAGHTLDGLCELLPHVAPLVDYVNLTAGVRTTYVKDMGTEEPPLLEAIERLRTVVEQPLLISQAFRRGHQIERALAAGADLVGIARPLIADPDFPAKLLSGREDQVRPCVSCNEDCRAFDPVAAVLGQSRARAPRDGAPAGGPAPRPAGRA